MEEELTGLLGGGPQPHSHCLKLGMCTQGHLKQGPPWGGDSLSGEELGRQPAGRRAGAETTPQAYVQKGSWGTFHPGLYRLC